MLIKGTKVQFLNDGGYIWPIPRRMCYGIVQSGSVLFEVRTYLKIFNIPVYAIHGIERSLDWTFLKNEIEEIK